MYDAFYPGRIWNDTDGKRIQAHGGSVIYVDGVYYWYGENKEFTNGTSDIWTYGVRCYQSRDLYNWEDLGLIIPPDLKNEASSLNPVHAMMDRPHIIYNKRTGKFVCWMKIMHDNGIQNETVMTADTVTGPYTLVKEGIRPLGMNAGDFDLAVAEDGKAYYYFERVHSETICADLNEAYTDVTGYYSTHFPHSHPPYVREATAHVLRKHRHYLFTSGTTGYLPNPSEVAVADTWHGPFTLLGNPHRYDSSHTSFHSQISCIFKVEGKKDLYIACADRWAPERTDLPYEEYEKLYVGLFAGTEKEKKEILQSDLYKRVCDSGLNTSIADYVWLPLKFVEPCEEYPEGMVFLDWYDRWKWEEFDGI